MDRTDALLRLAACLLVVATAPSAAAAQTLNYQTYLIGDRALGMGGAFTGLADDASAVFYNPAGLAQLRSGTLSGSLSVNAFNSYTVESGYGSPIGTADLEYDESPSVPLFASVVKKFGPRDEQEIRTWAVAFSTVNPVRTRQSFEVDLTNFESGVSSALRVDEEDTQRWIGPSLAFRVGDGLAFGASAFWASRSFFHREDEVVVTLGERQPDGVFRNSTVSVRESTVEVDADMLLLRVGSHLEIDERWGVGLMFQPPSVQIGGSSRIADRRAFADLLTDPATATFFLSDQGDLDSETRIPWELRLGVSYRHRDAFTAALDVSLYGPVGDGTDPVRSVGDPGPEPMTGEIPQDGIFVSPEHNAEMTANVSIGIEAVVAEVLPIRAGFFTDLSAAPAIDGPSDAYAPARVDNLGATLSVGIRAGGYDLAIGAAAIFGSGDGHRLNPQPGVGPTPQAFLPASVERTSVYFFVSGAQQAFGRLARTVYDEVLRSEQEQLRREQERRERELMERLRQECEERLRRELEDRADEPAVVPEEAETPPPDEAPIPRQGNGEDSGPEGSRTEPPE